MKGVVKMNLKFYFWIQMSWILAVWVLTLRPFTTHANLNSISISIFTYRAYDNLSWKVQPTFYFHWRMGNETPWVFKIYLYINFTFPVLCVYCCYVETRAANYHNNTVHQYIIPHKYLLSRHLNEWSYWFIQCMYWTIKRILYILCCASQMAVNHWFDSWFSLKTVFNYFQDIRHSIYCTLNSISNLTREKIKII